MASAGRLTLMSAGDIRPSTYNPREADEARLQLVALSLRKLGFVLPIVADQSGEIISGHQRHFVATERLGMESLPVLVCDVPDLESRKALNIVFNRGTNDMAVNEHGSTLRDRAIERVEETAAGLQDASDQARCLHPETAAIGPLADAARPHYNAHMRNMARTLWSRFRIALPIVATPGNRVINGLGRVQYASENDWPTVQVVRISDAEADFAAAVLNLLSMDFDIHTRYRDLLRHNSFRRARTVRTHLGTGFTFKLNRKGTKEFDIRDPATAERWKRTYGRSVVDFGAGHFHETDLLRGAGVLVAPFEPYRLGSNGEIDRASSVATARLFLKSVASGVGYSSVFLSSVLNSIPFAEDRRKVVMICAALCGPYSRFFTNAMHVGHENYTTMVGAEKFSKRRQETATFSLDYEPGIVLGDYMSKPKVQKYHSTRELYDLVKSAFASVNVDRRTDLCICEASQPVIDHRALREAIEFEFDLPYPDGSTMGLVPEALNAFSQRLGVTL